MQSSSFSPMHMTLCRVCEKSLSRPKSSYPYPSNWCHLLYTPWIGFCDPGCTTQGILMLISAAGGCCCSHEYRQRSYGLERLNILVPWHPQHIGSKNPPPQVTELADAQVPHIAYIYMCHLTDYILNYHWIEELISCKSVNLLLCSTV